MPEVRPADTLIQFELVDEVDVNAKAGNRLNLISHAMRRLNAEGISTPRV